MTKPELTKAVKEVLEGLFPEVKVTNVKAEELISGVATIIAEEVKQGGSVNLPGLGTVKTKVKKGRSGTINFGPSKGQKYKTEDATVLTITTDKTLAEQL